MSCISLENLLDTLRTCRILTSSQLNELNKLAPENANDPQALTQELVRRAWLSPFQAKQLLLGRGVHLVFGPYLIQERLGGGGNGQVFRARHRAMDRVVALKVLRKDLLADADAIGRFHREVEVISQLTHPCIVHAYDAGMVGAIHFLVMEYVDGADIDRLVRESGPLPAQQACDCIRRRRWVCNTRMSADWSIATSSPRTCWSPGAASQMIRQARSRSSIWAWRACNSQWRALGRGT
jgi:hypothetical protein